MTEQPQTYLITPPTFDPDAFAPELARVMDAVPVACVRLAMASRDEDEIARAADTLRLVCHDRDVSIVAADHLLLAQRLGLDGVHLTSAARGVRDARKAMGIEGIVGCFCGTSRHDGISAGEAGADYVSFGPVGGSLGDGTLADRDVFEWWSQMIELPVVAEGGLSASEVRDLAPFTDFFGFGEEIWSTEDPLATLRTLRAAMADG
ncbi:MAG: thiamine phosphate synthase [Rhodobacteraceae bacterium]|nr:thiamine phosphate synthase [Paracoccaceae bacterium]MAY46673.1 thiamine phosphate synthase [Paracoccaceae bacterium]QEW20549.1 thiamine-phosphate pyrophosphorylase [Marinibacterium anthonyi]